MPQTTYIRGRGATQTFQLQCGCNSRRGQTLIEPSFMEEEEHIGYRRVLEATRDVMVSWKRGEKRREHLERKKLSRREGKP